MNQQAFQGVDALLNGMAPTQEVNNLAKAVLATSQTGTQFWNTQNTGGSTKLESLDPQLKVITAEMKEAVAWKMFPKRAARNTVEEFNQLVNYGSASNLSLFTAEGDLGTSSSSTYNRRPVYIKRAQTVGEVSLTFDYVNVQPGVEGASMLRQEIQNRTVKLIQDVDSTLGYGDSSINPLAFDGIYKLHQLSVPDVQSNALESYFANTDVCLDAKGYRMDDDVIEAASLGVRQNFGSPDSLFTTPEVLSNYVKTFHESKRVMMTAPMTRDIAGGNRVNYMISQFGDLPLFNDVLWKKPVPRKGTDIAQGTAGKTPAAPTADPTTPVATATDVLGRFGGTATGYGAGDVVYAVASVNAYGISAMTVLSTAATTVSTTQAVDLKFSQTDNSYPATGFIIYRSKTGNLNATPNLNNFYPILNVSVAERAAGYSGGAAGLVRDRNYFLPDTDKAFVAEFDPRIMCIHQLIPLAKLDLALTSPMHRFMILMDMALALYVPKKVSVIHNIGVLAKA